MSKRTWKHTVRPVFIIASDCLIPLAGGQVAFVDAADAHLVRDHNWSLGDSCVRSGLGSLHHIILSPRDGLLPDHRDGDIMNNRRGNLRLATRAQNAQNRRRGAANTSGFKGVSYRSDRGTWLAAIRISERLVKIGTFHTAEKAAAAYDRHARAHFGAFAVLNFPSVGERGAA